MSLSTISTSTSILFLKAGNAEQNSKVKSPERDNQMLNQLFSDFQGVTLRLRRRDWDLNPDIQRKQDLCTDLIAILRNFIIKSFCAVPGCAIAALRIIMSLLFPSEIFV